MQRLLKWLAIVLGGLLLLALGLWLYLPHLNSYQASGELILPGLTAPVKVLRDEKGMAYIHAASLADANRAHGFLTAQDRLFQMEVIRRLATGRICELAGERARPLAMYYLTLGFYRHGQRLAAKLGPQAQRFLQDYLDGVNYYIAQRAGEHPLEFKLAGIEPTPWTMADSMAIQLFMSWGSSANLNTEVVAQMIVDRVGPGKAREILPLNVNPDEEGPPKRRGAPPAARLNLAADPALPLLLTGNPLALGSNNWVAGPRLSAGGKPMVANDPHLDARILPGPWYPCALITPQLRVVGVGVPGIPGIVVGRNQHVAWGVTNAYGDCQDLYVETLDPQDPRRYLEGGRSIPFEVVEETLSIKDASAPGGIRQEKVKVRLSQRGPVVSGVLKGLKTDKVLTLRWAPLEALGEGLGLDQAMQAKTAAQFRDGIQHMRHFVLNYVFADASGNIGWVVIGGLPIRGPDQGTIPYVVKDGRDNWQGWIPDRQMPQAMNPPRGWLGTCNHLTVTKDYPYYYTSRAAPSWRYRRLKELLSAPGAKTTADHWRFQRDELNLMARQLAPVLAQALLAEPGTRRLGRLLAAWDHRDRADAAAPLIFQAVYNRFALLVFRDDLGEDLARLMLDNYYFWKERLARQVLAGQWSWFDDATTPARETRDQLIVRAGREVLAELGQKLGPDPAGWRWGRVHTLNLVSPVARQGPLAGWLGAGARPLGGSESTLLRGIYDFNRPYATTIFASLRMVADLADPDKVMAVLPGGVAGRLFHPHAQDQVDAYMNGTPLYWWFSDRAIKEHAKSSLTLKPGAK
ncbi:MAG: penicillin acylase family protein [Desulfarculus sp.]|nr:MAG: penicillin acylase family protein [Desulfarculus sp.]